MAALLLKGGNKGVYVAPVSAPSAIDFLCQEKLCTIRRSKNSERAILEEAMSNEVIMAGTMDGRFAFPSFQAAFDGMFAIAKTIELLAACNAPLAGMLAEAPRRTFLRAKVSCALEKKGGVMRRMSEDSMDKEASYIDGIKVNFGEDWVLVLPDQYQPNFQIVAESKEPKTAQRLLEEFRDKVENWKSEQ
jgi:mannose-1-phosphate guanylyltransferase/phosphomannomutase